MLPEELIHRVRHIEITTRKMVDDLMGGSYRSNFKGSGVSFSEHRQYVAGDDVRHIDWKVSARSREPLIKRYEEERELTVFLVVDVSGSGEFGTGSKLKSEVAAEIGGMLAYAAAHAGDKVGVLLFSGKVEKIIPPKRGRQHILRIIRDILSFKPKSQGTALRGALEATHRIMKHTGVVFVISDFLADGYDVALRRLARKHDVIAISIGDERETEIPNVGQILLADPESGEERLVDTGSYQFKKWMKDFQTAHETDTQSAFRSGKVELLQVKTKDDYGAAVVRFFGARARRRR